MHLQRADCESEKKFEFFLKAYQKVLNPEQDAAIFRLLRTKFHVGLRNR